LDPTGFEKMTTIKVLQCVYSMNRGGVEAWLMHVLRKMDLTRYQIDFVVFSGQPGDFDDEIKSLGSRLFSCPSPSHPFSHARTFRSILRQYGPYDVVHSHASIWNGPVLSIAKKSGVPIRIAHSHNDILKSMPHSFVKRAYTKWSIWKSRQSATHGLACSRLAAASYFGADWDNDTRWRVFYCGEDFRPFADDVDAGALRQSLGIPENATVVGHVGSFRNMQKNHHFMIKVAQELASFDKDIYWLFVGDGTLRSEMEKRAFDAGLKDRMIFTGIRSDVPQLMLGAMDLFLFPSLSEGLGLALVEAQAAGLPCICSDVIPKEADVVPELTKRVSFTASPAQWAKTIKKVLDSMGKPACEEALTSVLESPFNLENSIESLEALYSEHKS
jgi:glycosyltransferase involved in cell wall biosynthesis